jgi:PAS domain S-box-containing protein
MADKQIHVLLIEDNPDDALLIKAMIQDKEHAGQLSREVLLSTDACLTDGLERLQRETVDVVLLDLGLPESTGFDTLNRFRHAAPDIAVIVLTGYDDDEFALQAVRSGAEDYLVKSKLAADSLQRTIRYARERQLNRRALHESEQRYRLLAEMTRDIIILHDMQGNILYVNQAGLNFAGYEPGEVIGKSLDEFIPQEHQPEVLARRAQRSEGEQQAYRYEIEFIGRKGARVPVEINSTPVVQNDCVYAILIVARDITERKRAEQEIRHKLAQLRALNEIDRAINSTLDPDRMFEVILHEITRIVRCDSMSLQILRDGQLMIVASQGFDLTEKVLQLVIPIDPKFPNYRVIQEGIPIGLEDVSREYPHFIEEASRFDSGHIRSWLGVPLIAGDKTIGMLTFDRNDVDPFNPDEVEVATLFAAQAAIALHNAQLYKTLEESEAGYRNIFEGIQDAIFVEDLDGAIVDVNARACELYGYSKETLLTMNARDLVSEDSPVLLLSELPNPDASPSPMETINQRADGKQIPVEITLRRGELKGKPVQLVVVRDISERKRSEDQIRNQVNRLEALRQIDLAIVGLADLETTLRIFLEQLTAQLEVDAACILLRDDVSGRLEFASSLGFRTKALQYTSLAEGEGNAGLAAATQKPIFIQDLEMKDTNFHSSPEFAAEGFQSYYAVPLIIREEVMGVIEIFHHSRLDPALEWIRFLDMLTTQAAIAIDNASLFTKLKHYNLDLERAVEDATREIIQTNKQLEAIINNSPDTVLLLTPQGVIERANSAIREQFDYDPGEIVGRHIDTLVQADAGIDLSTPLEELLHSVSPAFKEGTATRKDGTGFDAEMFFAPIRMDMNIFGFVCTIRDISEWKELGRMKDAFVSNVSHELRTPITSLRLNHSLMTTNPENQDKYLERFDREIDRLSQLIEDLLRLSRLDQGQIQPNLEPVDLELILADIVQDRLPLAETRQLEIEIVPGSASPAVQADANMIGQVLSVLLTNAIHYTTPGGRIKVRQVQGELEDFSWAGFSVEDDGPGVDPEDITHLFERFYRGKVGLESGSPGTGLGLAIANEILRRQNGQLLVESAGVSGQGTTFTVRLPVVDDSGEMKK